MLKGSIKVKDEELTFARATEITIETEDTAEVAKETVMGNT